MKSSSCFPPALVTVLDGTTYVVPGWQAVPVGTTLEQIEWEAPVRAQQTLQETIGVIATKDVVGSRGGHYHLEKWSDRKITCTCSGFKFRGKCKHLSQMELA